MARKPRPEFAFELGASPHIELGALLKATGLCGTGGEAKHRIQSGEVRVNGAVETRRGRKLFAGDRVNAFGRTIRVEGQPGAPLR